MKKILLRVETCITVPWFMLSWMLNAVFFAIKAGYLMARADEEGKAAILDSMFPKKTEKPTK